MKSQRVLAIVNKELKKAFRDVAVLFMIFLFPVVFVFAFGTFFGAVGGEQPVYEMGVVDMDQESFSQTFLTALSETRVLSLRVYEENRTAQEDLSQGKVQAVMIIPSDFTEGFASYQAAPYNTSRWLNTSVALYLDRGSLIATQVILPIVNQVLASVTGQERQASSSPFHLEVASLVDVDVMSPFEYMAPGMFTFASIYILMVVAQAFTQDRENGMMRRIRTTAITPTEFILGQVLSYMLIALVQAALVFATTYLLGFRPEVGLDAYALAFAILLVFSLSNVGFGLITATISRTPSAATGISFFFLLPQLFLGTFVGAQLSSSAQIACRFVPSYYVTDALTSLFLRGAGITSPAIMLDLAAVSASCIAILAVGIALYAKYFKA